MRLISFYSFQKKIHIFQLNEILIWERKTYKYDIFFQLICKFYCEQQKMERIPYFLNLLNLTTIKRKCNIFYRLVYVIC